MVHKLISSTIARSRKLLCEIIMCTSCRRRALLFALPNWEVQIANVCSMQSRAQRRDPAPWLPIGWIASMRSRVCFIESLTCPHISDWKPREAITLLDAHTHTYAIRKQATNGAHARFLCYYSNEGMWYRSFMCICLPVTRWKYGLFCSASFRNKYLKKNV